MRWTQLMGELSTRPVIICLNKNGHNVDRDYILPFLKEINVVRDPNYCDNFILIDWELEKS